MWRGVDYKSQRLLGCRASGWVWYWVLVHKVMAPSNVHLRQPPGHTSTSGHGGAPPVQQAHGRHGPSHSCLTLPDLWVMREHVHGVKTEGGCEYTPGDRHALQAQLSIDRRTWLLGGAEASRYTATNLPPTA